MYDNTPDAFSYASQNAAKLAVIEEELNRNFYTNPVHQLYRLVDSMNGQLRVLLYRLERLEDRDNENNNN